MTKTIEIQEKATKYLKESVGMRGIFQRFNMRLPLMIKFGVEDEAQIDFANHIDFFQLHYARYLIGSAKTLHRTFEELDQLKAHQFFDEDFFWCFIGEIKLYLFENEMYESLELYNRSINKVVKRAGFKLK